MRTIGSSNEWRSNGKCKLTLGTSFEVFQSCVRFMLCPLAEMPNRGRRRWGARAKARENRVGGPIDSLVGQTLFRSCEEIVWSNSIG